MSANKSRHKQLFMYVKLEKRTAIMATQQNQKKALAIQAMKSTKVDE